MAHRIICLHYQENYLNACKYDVESQNIQILFLSV